MTEKELLQRAEAYAKEIYADCDLSDIGVQDEINALALNCMCFAKVLMEDCCLVEKSKIKEEYSNATEQGKHAHIKFQIESRVRIKQLESLFGKELFSDTEQ